MERMTNPYESPQSVAPLLPAGGSRAASWKWLVCGLLFLATMLMYMDRQTLATMAKRICDELHLSKGQYGQLEMGFGLAFAVGAIINGLIADRVSIRWLYPLMLTGWSVMGIATAFSVEIGEAITPCLPAIWPFRSLDPPFVGLMICRVLLGFFESGHWPCALITTQRLLSANDRTFGNSLLQSGASVGAVLTPLAVWVMLTDSSGSWRNPFMIIGMVGMAWIIPWLLLVRGSDLSRQPPPPPSDDASVGLSPSASSSDQASDTWLWVRRTLVLLAIVIPINFTWQFFRAWLALLMQEEHGYSEQFVFGFTSAYYLVADLGCIAVGAAVTFLTARGWHRQHARSLTFVICTILTSLGILAAFLPRGLPLLAVFLTVGFGCLGMFPTYYSLTQEMSRKHQGLISGLLGFTTWVTFALCQPPIGRLVDATKSYNTAIFWIVQAPIIACVALVFFWGRSAKDDAKTA